MRAPPTDLNDESGWLVYSDWLLSRNEPLRAIEGELIALEHALHHATSAQRASVGARLRAVSSTYQKSCLGGLSGAPHLQAKFRWGQLTEVEIGADFEGTLRALLALPISQRLQTVRIAGLENHTQLERTLQLLSKRCPPELDLSGHNLSGDWLGVLEKAVLPGLKSLRLARCGLSEVELLRLFKASYWGDLERLDLDENKLGDDGAALLSKASLPLRILRLGVNGVSHEGLLAISQAPWSAGLQGLNLENNAFTLKVLDPLGRFAHLRSLGLAKNNMKDADLARLFELGFPQLQTLELGGNSISLNEDPMRFPPQLTKLDLKFNTIGPKAIARLLPASGGLEALDLAYNDLLAQGALALASVPWPKLKALVLRGCQLRDEGVEALAQGSASVLSLDLSYNEMGSRGIHALMRAAPWQKLRRLNLRGNRIGWEAIRALARLAALKELEELALGNNQLGDQGAIELGKAEHLRALRVLTISGSGVSAKGAKALAQAEVLRHLQRLELDPKPLGRAGRNAMLRSTVLPEHIRSLFE